LLSAKPRFLAGLLALLSRDDLLPEVTLVDAVDMSLSTASSVKLLILESAFNDKDPFFQLLFN